MKFSTSPSSWLQFQRVCIFISFPSHCQSFSVGANESGSTAPYLSSPLVLVPQVHGRNKSTRCQVTRRLMSIPLAPWENRCLGYTDYTHGSWISPCDCTVDCYNVPSPPLVLYGSCGRTKKTTTWLLWHLWHPTASFCWDSAFPWQANCARTCTRSRGRANGSLMTCKRSQWMRMLDLFLFASF